MLDEAEECLDPRLIQKQLSFNTLGDILEYLFKTKGRYKNAVRVSLIKAGLKDLKNAIKQTPKIKITDKGTDVIVNLVEKILDTNERQLDRFYTPEESPRDKDFGSEIRRMFDNEEIADMPELGSEESAAQRRNQRGQGLKIITPQQMLSRLPISLSRIKQEIIHKNLRMK